MLFKDIITISGRNVQADKKSIRQNEFYQAAAMGLRPEIMFIVRTAEYNGERELAYEGKVYTIIRTFDRDDEMTEIICEGAVATEV